MGIILYLTVTINLTLWNTVSFINNLAKSYNNGKQTDDTFMDTAKAFDTVPHKRLRVKLQWYGIVGNSYLPMDLTISKWPLPKSSYWQCFIWLGISCVWCPSGNSSGPHIIYNDVIENIKHSKIRLFADDIVLYKEISAVRDAQQLQEDLESLQLWEGTCMAT